MSIYRLSAALLTVLLLGACSENGEDKEVLFKEQRETLEQALEVEQTLLDAAEAQRRQLEEQSR